MLRVFFNEGRLFTDSVLLHESGEVYDSSQFLTRWITHICAPTFIFLTGASIAISNAQRLQLGMPQSTIDRELLIRGLFIALLDVVVLSLMSGKLVLQVLYAIGAGMMMMVWLRRLNIRVVLMLAVAILAGSEGLLSAVWTPGEAVPLVLALTFAPFFADTYSILYPAIPWLAMMMLGWVFGCWMVAQPPEKPKQHSIQRMLLFCGSCALLGFIVIRVLDDYGNMFMLLEGHSAVQWLHVSKYPPSLAYTVLELGLMAIVLAVLIQVEPYVGVRQNGAVLVFGQTALFFYLAHFGVLSVLRVVFDSGGLEMAYLMAFLALLVLYPLCRVYRMFKWRYSKSLLRFM